MSTILVIDDVAALAEQYAYDLRRIGGHDVTVVTSGALAVERLSAGPVDCAILDLEMPGMDGFEVLRALGHRGVETPVIVYTGTGNFDRCIEAVKLGAAGFIDKAEPMERVAQEVANAIERHRLRREVFALQRRLGESTLAGRSPAIEALRAAIARLAPIPSPVLILGESGTGKELVARELHRLGANPSGPFVTINAAALPEQLVESELFGHEKGAFTGAVAARRGAFESAEHGTLFLDEIGELPPTVQPKLLRALEQHTVTRLGSNRDVAVNARVVAATHRDLDQAVRDRTFREDLLFRLNVHVLAVPPLRDRREDVPVLAERFVDETCRRFGILPKTLAPEAREALVRYDWARNNVRELRNAMERSVVAADGEVIRAEHLPAAIRGAPGGVEADDDYSFQAQRAAAERRIVVAALEKHDWHVTRTAEALGLADHASLLKIMRRLGVSR
ncbi:MAG: sigma-54-dependent Fis family transcriptional regulator [Gemmatimonadota bacterium]|nr:sigma-54-dependent Fis family transcriptional regulator [Gemmatimonadota bacterium]MDE3215674.1 sigma-54-dependent Fis family transcriptional regulator [Gemmatimonadota bacterium]